MIEEQTTPDETGETEEESEQGERDGGTPSPPPPPPPPPVAHHPIELAVTNLNALQTHTYLQSLGKIPNQNSYFDNPADINSGDELLVTLTLNSPVIPGELPYIVDIIYVAVQNSSRKVSGVFLYKQTTVATFIPGLPNDGSLKQQFPLQTIRFDLPTAQEGPADIEVLLYNGGQYVGKDDGSNIFTINAGYLP